MINIKCGVYLRAAFISLEIDVEGGVYSRAALNRVNTVLKYFRCSLDNQLTSHFRR